MQFAEGLSPEDMKVFLQEADEQLQLLNDGLLSLERGGTPEVMAAIFRAAHTLKGSSAMVGHRQMTDVAHAMETLLDRVRRGTLKVTPGVADALLHSVDALQTMKQEIAGHRVSEHDFAGLLKDLEEAAGEGAIAAGGAAAANPGILSEADAREHAGRAAVSGLTAYLVEARFAPESPFRAVRAFQLLTELQAAGEVVRSDPGEAQINAEQVGATFHAVVISGRLAEDLRRAGIGVADVASVEVRALAAGDAAQDDMPGHIAPAQAGQGGGEAAEKQGHRAVQTVRIDVAQLDGLMNLIGELVIDRTRIEQLGRMLGARYQGDDVVEALGKTSAHIVKVVNDLQEDFMKVRMLPVSTVFASFPRMMRDLARKLDKQLDLRVSGGETEIDKTVIERVRDPLVHLLRNALDHGLEGPDERRLAGKAPAGVIELTAFHEQGQIVIRVSDDGRGIDAERVKASAVSKGLVGAESAARMDARQALDLIFLPGTSTRETASEVSGRGVGMDIVRSNIEAIGGMIGVVTEAGRGTTFTLRLPLTLATVKSVLVRSGGTVYAVPLMYVLEAVNLRPDQVPTVRGHEVFRLRDRVVPVVDLAEATGCGAGEARRTAGPRRIVVARAGERLAGLGVDELLEPMEVVVKPLGKQFSGARGVSGASILGDGRVVLILDVPGLTAAAVARQQAQADEWRDKPVSGMTGADAASDGHGAVALAEAA